MRHITSVPKDIDKNMNETYINREVIETDITKKLKNIRVEREMIGYSLGQQWKNLPFEMLGMFERGYKEVIKRKDVKEWLEVEHQTYSKYPLETIPMIEIDTIKEVFPEPLQDLIAVLRENIVYHILNDKPVGNLVGVLEVTSEQLEILMKLKSDSGTLYKIAKEQTEILEKNVFTHTAGVNDYLLTNDRVKEETNFEQKIELEMLEKEIGSSLDSIEKARINIENAMFERTGATIYVYKSLLGFKEITKHYRELYEELYIRIMRAKKHADLAYKMLREAIELHQNKIKPDKWEVVNTLNW